MFRKLNPKILLSGFAILLVIVVLVKLNQRKSGDRSFRSEIVEVDTSKVTQVVITAMPGGSEEKLFLEKSGETWKVTKEGTVYNADEIMVERLLEQLINMKPQRVAATTENRWTDFEVTDSAGIFVKVKGGSKTLAEVIIGKFSYQQPTNPYDRQGKMTSYVRVEGENEVYAVDGFLRMTFSTDAGSYRDKAIISGNKSNWTKLKFRYPADSSFVLEMQGNQWMTDGILADSASVAQYLSRISQMTSHNFVDTTLDVSDVPEFSLEIEGDNMVSSIKVDAFEADTTNKYLVTSNQNEGAFFSGAKAELFEKIFVPKSEFFLVEKSGEE
ncbi:MAG: DUF4340 domain-containing protein [Bacteroidota bacterium]